MSRSQDSNAPIIAVCTTIGRKSVTRVIHTAEQCEELLRKHRGHVRVTQGDNVVGERWVDDGKWYWSMSREYFK